MSQERARLLIEQNRWPEATAELGKAIAEDPEDGWNYHLLALVKSQQDSHEEARELSRQALLKEPENSIFRLGLAWREYSLGNAQAALREAQAVISQDPGYPAVYGLLSTLSMDRREWEEALSWAEQGLALDPEDQHCLQLRTMALGHLSQGDEAESAALHAVSLDPDSAYAHSALGWTHLRNARTQDAEESFREALWLDPQSESARLGLAEVLKARFWPYRLWLRYAFWASNLGRGRLWVFILSIYFGQRILRFISTEMPEYAWLSVPLGLALTGFVLTTWFADPIAELILRLHPFGRLLQSARQRFASTVFGSLLAGAIGFVLFGFYASALCAAALGLMWDRVLSAQAYSWRRGPRLLTQATSILGLIAMGGDLVGNERVSSTMAALVIVAFMVFGWWNAVIASSADGRDR